MLTIMHAHFREYILVHLHYLRSNACKSQLRCALSDAGSDVNRISNPFC